MKKRISVFVCLAFFSLACLGSAALDAPAVDDIVEASPTLGFVKVIEVPAVVVPTATDEPRGLCAVVVAAESLHLRRGPSADDIVLIWLRRGDVVEVLDRLDPDWWRVGFEGVSGYARSVFLEVSDCEVSNE